VKQQRDFVDCVPVSIIYKFAGLASGIPEEGCLFQGGRSDGEEEV
jgi:hypothetical protein